MVPQQLQTEYGSREDVPFIIQESQYGPINIPSLPPRGEGVPSPLPPRREEIPPSLPSGREDVPPPLPPGRVYIPPPLPPGREDITPPLPPGREDIPPPLPPRREEFLQTRRDDIPPPLPPRPTKTLPHSTPSRIKQQGFGIVVSPDDLQKAHNNISDNIGKLKGHRLDKRDSGVKTSIEVQFGDRSNRDEAYPMSESTPSHSTTFNITKDHLHFKFVMSYM